MSYVRNNLMPNERLLFSARAHPAVFLRSIVSFALTIVAFLIGLSNSAVVVTKAGSPAAEFTGTALLGTSLLCISGILFVNSILLGLQAIIIMSTTEFAITNRRVVAKTGFVRRHTLEMLLQKIESVTVRQGVLGRLFNFGTVTVTGTGGTRESFRAITDPVGVRWRINQIIESYVQGDHQNPASQASGVTPGG